MNKLLLFLFINISLTSFGQIQIGGETDEPKKETEKKAKPEKTVQKKNSDSEIFLGTNWSATNRVLIENKGLFGDSLGERANETGVNRWSFGLGFRTKLNNYLMMEGGVSYLQNGETYLFEGTDTSSTYTNSYQYIGMPIKLYYFYGQKKLRFQVGVGVIPQMALNFRQSSTIIDSGGNETSESIKTKIGYSSFAVSIVGNIGIQYEFTPTWSIYVLPEYRRQLTSSYLNTNKYQHFGTALGVNVGFVKAL